jgi:hypothetical protein
MFDFILAATARCYFFLRQFMPTAIVIDAINTRRGLKWGGSRDAARLSVCGCCGILSIRACEPHPIVRLSLTGRAEKHQ